LTIPCQGRLTRCEMAWSSVARVARPASASPTRRWATAASAWRAAAARTFLRQEVRRAEPASAASSGNTNRPVLARPPMAPSRRGERGRSAPRWPREAARGAARASQSPSPARAAAEPAGRGRSVRMSELTGETAPAKPKSGIDFDSLTWASKTSRSVRRAQDRPSGAGTAITSKTKTGPNEAGPRAARPKTGPLGNQGPRPSRRRDRSGRRRPR